jgi:hypothetical protein
MVTLRNYLKNWQLRIERLDGATHGAVLSG